MDANELRRMMKLPDDAEHTELANAIRAAIFELMERHEKGNPHHPNGEPCGMNRVGLIAWFAHSLGINRAHADKLLVAIEVYDTDCQCGSPTLQDEHFAEHD